MSAIDRRPSNLNWLTTANFRFVVHKLPNTIWNLQRINLPGVSLPAATEPTPFTDLHKTGDHVQWEELQATFAIDEYFANYLELWNWIMGSGFPIEHEQFKTLNETVPKTDGLYSPAALLINDSNQRPIVEVNFWDIRPIAISSVDFDTTLNDVQFAKCTVVFKYNFYTIDRR